MNFNAFLDSLQYMWKGLLGIFIVIICIMLSVYIMNYISNKISKKK